MNNKEKRAYNKLLSVISQKCRDCSGGQAREVERCSLVPVYQKRTLVTGCALWPYRQGMPTEADGRKLKRVRLNYEKTQESLGKD